MSHKFIAITNSDGVEYLLNTDQIIAVASDDPGVTIHLTNNVQIYSDMTLEEFKHDFEKQLHEEF